MCVCAVPTAAYPKLGENVSQDEGFRVIGNGIDTLSDV